MNAPVQAVPQIDVETFDRLRRTGSDVTVLDIREPWERDICTLEPSLAIPLGQLPDRLDCVPRAGALVVLCHHGVRSRRATLWLHGQGFPAAVNLDGGIDAWAGRIDRTMTRY